MNHLVLFEPLMPANVGNIARTAAATNSILHLIKPLGFDLNDKQMKRAGLDYWDKVEVMIEESLPDFLDKLKPEDQLFLVSKFAGKTYDQADYKEKETDYYFLFGKETTGLPEIFMRDNSEKAVRIPQNDQHVRSLNLSNTVAIVIYEALRQQDFRNLNLSFVYEEDKLK